MSARENDDAGKLTDNETSNGDAKSEEEDVSHTLFHNNAPNMENLTISTRPSLYKDANFLLHYTLGHAVRF